MVSNYDITRDETEKRFLMYDQQKIIDRFQLKHDEEYLYLTFIGHPYRINRSTGRVEWSTDEFKTVHHGNFNEVLTIFDVLCDSKEYASLSGNFVPPNGLPGIVKGSKVGEGFFFEQIKRFEHRLEDLRKACEALGGIPQKVGDVSYELPLFPDFPILLQFWDSDDEFEAVLMIKWDYNTLQFMRYETTYYATGHLMERLMEEAGI